MSVRSDKGVGPTLEQVVNRGATALGWNLDAYRRRVDAFGGCTIESDRFDVRAIDDAFTGRRHGTGDG
jgi:transketolase